MIRSGIGEYLNNNGPITAPRLLRAIRGAERRSATRVFDTMAGSTRDPDQPIPE